MLATLRWLLPSLIPALIALVIREGDVRKEPWRPLLGTFALGLLFALPTYWIQAKANAWTGLDQRGSVAGDTGALLFLFAVIAPMRELAKVAAAWPAFRSVHFDEPLDGAVYASFAAMGFATADTARHLLLHPVGAIWLARVVLAIPAHLFFACLWGYALGRAKHTKNPRALAPTVFAAILMHGFYSYFVYWRPPGALVAVAAMLVAMGIASAWMVRDLRVRGDRPFAYAPDPLLGGRLSAVMSVAPPTSSQDALPSSGSTVSAMPSLRAVRAALRRADEPVRLRWIVFGTLVTLGAMIAGLVASVIFARYAHVDFAAVDERDMSTTAPVALLGAGLLAAFPLSGFLVARASGLSTLLEPAIASALAIVAALILLGFAAPIAMVFALAFSPVAFALACAGAWVGRPVR